MASLVQTGKYGAMNKTDHTMMGYYVVKYALDDYTLQEDTDELAIKRFSLVNLSYQPSFNTSSRNYGIYELTIRHNQSYFSTYHLDYILPTK